MVSPTKKDRICGPFLANTVSDLDKTVDHLYRNSGGRRPEKSGHNEAPPEGYSDGAGYGSLGSNSNDFFSAVEGPT